MHVCCVSDWPNSNKHHMVCKTYCGHLFTSHVYWVNVNECNNKEFTLRIFKPRLCFKRLNLCMSRKANPDIQEGKSLKDD